jgi:hypothetical protein
MGNHDSYSDCPPDPRKHTPTPASPSSLTSRPIIPPHPVRAYCSATVKDYPGSYVTLDEDSTLFLAHA